MKVNLLFFFTLIFVFSGCLNDDNDSTSTLASQTEVAAKLPNSVSATELAEDVVGSQTITLNPTLIFSEDGTTLTYSNDLNDTGYPATVNGQIDVNSSKEEDRLILSFTVGGQKIEIGFSFIDRGGEGYIDEAILDVAKVDDTEQTISEKVTLTLDAGQLPNAGVAEEDRPDLSGAPTTAEWNRYLVGTAILLIEDKGLDNTLVRFNSSSSGQYVDLDEGYIGNFSYTYKNEGNNTGEISITENWVNAGQDYDSDYPDSNGSRMRSEFSVSLTFVDFYNGRWVDGPEVTTDLDSGKTYEVNDDEQGSFNAITNVTLYLEDNSKTGNN